MKQLESGLVSKKLSKNESTLLTQIHYAMWTDKQDITATEVVTIVDDVDD